MKINHPEVRIRSELMIERTLDKLSDSRDPASWDNIKGHWLSLILTILYGYIAWNNSPNQLVLFLGIITVVCTLQSENHARRAREYEQIENALRELLALVRDQAKTIDQAEKIAAGETVTSPHVRDE